MAGYRFQNRRSTTSAGRRTARLRSPRRVARARFAPRQADSAPSFDVRFHRGPAIHGARRPNRNEEPASLFPTDALFEANPGYPSYTYGGHMFGDASHDRGAMVTRGSSRARARRDRARRRARVGLRSERVGRSRSCGATAVLTARLGGCIDSGSRLGRRGRHDPARAARRLGRRRRGRAAQRNLRGRSDGDGASGRDGHEQTALSIAHRAKRHARPQKTTLCRAHACRASDHRRRSPCPPTLRRSSHRDRVENEGELSFERPTSSKRNTLPPQFVKSSARTSRTLRPIRCRTSKPVCRPTTTTTVNPGVTIVAQAVTCTAEQELFVALRAAGVLSGKVGSLDAISGLRANHFERVRARLQRPVSGDGRGDQIVVEPDSPFRAQRVSGNPA